jgi:hypothetical protein
VNAGVASADQLRQWFLRGGVAEVSVLDHEDDLPEARLLLDWIWPRLSPARRRLLAVLAHVEGDHVDAASLVRLAGVRARPASEIAALRRWHVIQEPLAGRYTLHATIRHAVARRTRFDPRRAARHYLALLDREPDRLDLEQTHLFAAMDLAHSGADLGMALRIDRLLARVGLA